MKNSYSENDIYADLPVIERYPEFDQFLKDHNLHIDEPLAKILIHWLIDILHTLGYSIEITEMSTGDISKNINTGSNWKRLNKFRWSIVYWNKDGYMVSAKYSDNEKRNEFNSINDANEDAIRYIVEHYKEIENYEH